MREDEIVWAGLLEQTREPLFATLAEIEAWIRQGHLSHAEACAAINQATIKLQEQVSLVFKRKSAELDVEERAMQERLRAQSCGAN